jgi:hypothetical protein
MRDVMQQKQLRSHRTSARRWSFRTSALELEQFKQCLLGEHRSARDLHVHSWLNRAAHEAASIAWATPYPLLVLPVLLEEKFEDAWRKAELQKAIYERTQPIVALAA